MRWGATAPCLGYTPRSYLSLHFSPRILCLLVIGMACCVHCLLLAILKQMYIRAALSSSIIDCALTSMPAFHAGKGSFEAHAIPEEGCSSWQSRGMSVGTTPAAVGTLAQEADPPHTLRTPQLHHSTSQQQFTGAGNGVVFWFLSVGTCLVHWDTLCSKCMQSMKALCVHYIVILLDFCNIPTLYDLSLKFGLQTSSLSQYHMCERGSCSSPVRQGLGWDGVG